MAIEFNHTIVWAKDSAASAAFLADILGLPAPRKWGHFQIVATANSSGVVKSSSQYTWGKASASCRFMRRARRTSASRDSGLRALADARERLASGVSDGVACT